MSSDDFIPTTYTTPEVFMSIGMSRREADFYANAPEAARGEAELRRTIELCVTHIDAASRGGLVPDLNEPRGVLRRVRDTLADAIKEELLFECGPTVGCGERFKFTPGQPAKCPKCGRDWSAATTKLSST